MAGRIEIDTERCKGCGLCVVVCPKGSIVISRKSNRNGYFPAQPVSADRRPVQSGVEGASNSDCTGCAVCAIICPEAVIEVFRDGPGKVEIIVEPGKDGKTSLIEEKV